MEPFFALEVVTKKNINESHPATLSHLDLGNNRDHKNSG